MDNYIKIRGARQHNLKNINLEIPKNKLIVFTGVSGSGKSSLAFDTIYAEGQRRYVESLSTYARQFLGIMEKPDIDSIEGLSPAISIDQKTTSRNPRSTVGTVTEIYDYFRLLYARVGHPHCPICGREISTQSLDQIVNSCLEAILTESKKRSNLRFFILSPIIADKKGEYSSLFDNLKSKGYAKARIDRQVRNLAEDLVLIKTNKHTIEAVCDRMAFSSRELKNPIFLDNLKNRLSQSHEQALKLSDGLSILSFVNDKTLEFPDYPKLFEDHLFSEKFSCPVDNIQLPEIEPRTFSFNSPHGACTKCNGIGKILKIEPEFVFSKELSISEGGILPFKNMFEHDTWFSRLIIKICEEAAIDIRAPIGGLGEEKLIILLAGTGKRQYSVEGTNRFGHSTHIYETFHGIVAELERRHSESESDWVRAEIERYMREIICPDCCGARLKKEALAITIDKLSIYEATNMAITNIQLWIRKISSEGFLSSYETQIAKNILNEIEKRINFLNSVGLEYLTLARPASSLSGGEAQRIRLASQIGSGLTGVLYILDEPTIGLHPKDNYKLISTLKALRDLGNTVIVVEHDEEMMRNSDLIYDFGPGAGKFGGELIAHGKISDIITNNKSLTGKYLSGKKKIDIKTIPNKMTNTKHFNRETNHVLKIFGCSQFNLKNIDAYFPLGKLVVITGVSGSGKSTLLVETLYPAVKAYLSPLSKEDQGLYKRIEGVENVNKVVLIDQSPIGRTPRSNPATYTKLFDLIRDVFAQTREARLNGFKKGRFSFNVKGGRCEACEGQGQIKIEMQFMSDVWINCEVCKGKRYNSHTLDVHFRGKNISEILNLTVGEAIEYFHAHTQILTKLNTLSAVGLDYIELGQSATTLSGGEAQRVKLSTELSKKETGHTLYILDEPTTGLHFSDVERLLRVLKLLVSKGNSVIIIEHNMDIIKNADYLIDVGPEGGDNGGELVAKGTITQIKNNKNSYTGKYLNSRI